MSLKDSKEKIKAVAMLSGGLDSSLAVKIVADQGVEVLGVNYNTGFCLTDHRRKMYGLGARLDPQSLRNEALAAGAKWGLPVEIADISDEYLRILTRPRYGYGSAINPCIDCRIFMLRKTREYMEKVGARFIITGEVVGQRPMSQMRKTLKLIEKESGCEGLILRPLSAKLLEPTIAEINGWVDREKLYGFNGRSRKPQIKLAKEIGLEEYPQPAGGCCFLTDKNYARRMRDLFRHADKKSVTTDQVLLLKVGRHFRLDEQTKVIVGRNEAENLFLEKTAGRLPRLNCSEVQGPLSLIEGSAEEEAIRTAARITARYSDAGSNEPVEVKVVLPDESTSILKVQPMDLAQCEKMRI
jgi:tRNA-specific 2-thiouridylase